MRVREIIYILRHIDTNRSYSAICLCFVRNDIINKDKLYIYVCIYIHIYLYIYIYLTKLVYGLFTGMCVAPYAAICFWPVSWQPILPHVALMSQSKFYMIDCTFLLCHFGQLSYKYIRVVKCGL